MKIAFIEDSFVFVGPFHEKNVGKAHTGVITASWYSEKREWMLLEDERVFSRSSSYYPGSPWGWKYEGKNGHLKPDTTECIRSVLRQEARTHIGRIAARG